MNLHFNLPAGVTIADIDPEDLDDQREREEARADRRYEQHRDREASDLHGRDNE